MTTTEQLSIFDELNSGVTTVEEHQRFRSMEFKEAFEKYDLVDAVHDPVNGSYVIMAEKSSSVTTGYKEMGYAYPSPWTSWTRDEKVSELRDQVGIRTYYDMKRSDGTVRGMLRTLKTPIQSAHWYIKPASDAPIDMKIAEFVEDNLFNRLNVPWNRVIEDALIMCEYGFSSLEKVWDIGQDGKIYLKKLAPRHPLDIREWLYDENGGPRSLVMEGNEVNGFNEVTIPIDKLAVFVLEQEGGDMRGISVLRSAYKHFYYKNTLYAIDAIQKERHGIGVPIITLPMGFTKEDREIADELGRNLRVNERAHITIPANWVVAFAKLEGQPVDCLKSIDHHDKKIMSNVLVPFLDDSNSDTESMDMFFKSTRYIAQTISDTFNHHVIRQLKDMNFAEGGYPKLSARRIGEWTDLRTWSFAMRNFVGAGMIRPDDTLEEFTREAADCPPMDKTSTRIVGKTVQDNVEPPEKPKVEGSKQKTEPPVKVPETNAGTDRSGG